VPPHSEQQLPAAGDEETEAGGQRDPVAPPPDCEEDESLAHDADQAADSDRTRPDDGETAESGGADGEDRGADSGRADGEDEAAGSGGVDHPDPEPDHEKHSEPVADLITLALAGEADESRPGEDEDSSVRRTDAAMTLGSDEEDQAQELGDKEPAGLLIGGGLMTQLADEVEAAQGGDQEDDESAGEEEEETGDEEEDALELAQSGQRGAGVDED
jgi:hypothetical protein